MENLILGYAISVAQLGQLLAQAGADNEASKELLAGVQQHASKIEGELKAKALAKAAASTTTHDDTTKDINKDKKMEVDGKGGDPPPQHPQTEVPGGGGGGDEIMEEDFALDGEDLEGFKKQMVENGVLQADATPEAVRKIAEGMGAWLVVNTRRRKQRKA